MAAAGVEVHVAKGPVTRAIVTDARGDSDELHDVARFPLCQ